MQRPCESTTINQRVVSACGGPAESGAVGGAASKQPTVITTSAISTAAFMGTSAVEGQSLAGPHIAYPRVRFRTGRRSSNSPRASKPTIGRSAGKDEALDDQSGKDTHRDKNKRLCGADPAVGPGAP